MPQYRMLIDSDKCMNCGACVLGCQQRNTVSYGYFRNWVREAPSKRHASGKGYQPGGCMQCDAPLCVDACPTMATWKGTDGVIIIDPERCIGCGACLAACPYDARYRDPVRGTADKCDYCASTRALGLPPACVQLCPTKARLFGDSGDPASPVSRALGGNKLIYVESAASPTKPTLAYLGKTAPTDWPRAAAQPTPIAAMSVLSTGIRWLGGLALFGVVAMFFKQIILPSDTTGHDAQELENNGRKSNNQENKKETSNGKGDHS